MEDRHALQERLIVLGEGSRLIGVDVDLADHAPLVADGDDDLAPRRRKAGQVAIVRAHVVDDLRAAAGGRRAAEALPHGNPHVLCGLRALPGAENEILSLDEIDAHPGVVIETIVEHLDGLSKHLVRLAFALDDLAEGLEGTRVVAHRGTASSRSAPSKAATTSL
jgi:hypothetical protein